MSTEDGEGLLAVDYLGWDGHFDVVLGIFLDAGIKIRGLCGLFERKR